MRPKRIRTYTDAVSIVTGGASGIGRALGEELAKQGSEVILADLQTKLAEEVAAGIRSAGGKAGAVKIDVTDYTAVETLVQQTVQRTGRLDYMFNNAGIAIAGDFHLHSIQDWNNIIDVNLRGVVNGVQAAYPVMQEQGFGHIVNTASMAGLITVPFLVSYSTTKHAVVGLSKSLRVEAAPAGVRVSVICPGVIRTPILDGGKYGKLLVEIPPLLKQEIWKRLKPMPPGTFAPKVLKALAKNKAFIIVPSRWKFIWWFNRLAPSPALSLAGKSFQKAKKEIKKMTVKKKPDKK